MKKLKKTLALMIALVIALGMGATVFAANTNTITVDVNFQGQTYTLYKIFDATVTDERAAAVDENNATSVITAGIAYTLIDENLTAESGHGLDAEYYITTADGTTKTVKAGDWFMYVNPTNHNITLRPGADITSEDFRLFAQQYGVWIEPALTADSDNDANIKWTGLADGYYFITTTTGTLVTVDSVAPSAIVKDKNTVPTIDKTVSGGTEMGGHTAADNEEQNTASIGDTLIFTTTIHAKTGATRYTLTDTMEDGLSLVNYTNADNSAGQAEVKLHVLAGTAELHLGTDYTIDTFEKGKGGTFTITFSEAYLSSITDDNKNITVSYKALVNEDAEIANADGTSKNTNTATLKYGANETKTSDTTDTFVYKFQIVKDDSNKKVLTGAKFKLFDAENGGHEIPVVKTGEGKYRVALPTETGVEIEAGVPEISGLGNGTYWVEETEAPSGYNRLSSRTSVTIVDANNMATFNHGSEIADTYTADDTYNNGGLEVVNQEGTILPSTGGIGTTLFYVVGAILVIGAGVLLVTRRMSDR